MSILIRCFLKLQKNSVGALCQLKECAVDISRLEERSFNRIKGFFAATAALGELDSFGGGGLPAALRASNAALRQLPHL